MKKNLKFSMDAADFINKLLKKKNKQRLGSRGIDEIKNHKWLDDIDWINIEYKNIDTNDIGILKILKRNQIGNNNIEDINFKSIIDKYSSILNKINKENIFKDFYFNYIEIKNKDEKENKFFTDDEEDENYD